MKKIIAAAIALTAVFAFVVTVSAQASTVFTTNLTVGSTGSDVVALQSFLEAKGLLVIPAGTSKGYFGGLTKAALAKYQLAKGITPAVGYFGPITRAAVNADGGTPVVTTPGCPAGAMFNSMTGAPCTTTPTTPTTPTSGAEGTLDVRLAGSPANNANVQTSTDVPVYGLTLKASISPVTVDRIDLQVAVVNSGSTENPATLINTIKVWDGSSVVKSWAVTSADFTKDVNDSTVYYIRLSGLGFTVPTGTTKTLVVSFSTNGGIDTDRTVTIDGYQSNSLRAVSGNNITSYYSIDGSGFTRVHTFKKPGTSTLTLSSDSATPRSTNYRYTTTDGATGVTIGSFNVKSDTGDSTVTDVQTTVTGGASASTIYLYDGSTLLDSRSAAAVVKFSNLSVAVAKDQIKTLTIKADIPSSIATGTAISAGASTTVTYQKPNGTSVNSQLSGITVYPQFFYTTAPKFTFVSGTATAGGTNQQGSTTNISATFTFNIDVVGGSMLAPTTTAVKVFYGQGATTTSATVASVSISPNDSTLADGGHYTVTVSTSPIAPATTGTYTFYVNEIDWMTSTGIAVAQTAGFNTLDWKTNSVVFIK